jgi:protein-S-isoprenylcysteine O-methyltransferase Ste14
MAKTYSPKTGFNRATLIDISIRITLGIFFAFTAGIYYRNAMTQMQSIDMSHINAASFGEVLSILASGLYTIMIACLYVLRHRPINTFAGWWPSIAALLGGFMMFGLVWFKPNMDLSIAWRVAGCCMVFIGNIFAAYILTKLGRSFSILPESRKLVTHGPYKIMRHPLYISEAVSSLGTMILFFSTGAVALVVLQTALQLVRIHYEERVLTKNFPEYKNYAKRTARFIPGIY